jgi:lipopolysaccharide cholinephosphotransferase
MAVTKPTLTKSNLEKARKILFDVTALLEAKSIPYHLEGGTLLGIVRDKDLLPWDYDVDISVPYEHLHSLLKLKFSLLLSGYKISARKSQTSAGPIHRGDHYLLKIKPLTGYLINLFVKAYKENYVVLDIFLKRDDGVYTYWVAQGKTMRVENKYYQSHETVEYQNVRLRVPNQYKDYLTQKYGDWTIPVKEWDCSLNELTILK